MTNPTSHNGGTRPLLVNGETLKIKVQPSRSGGGEKYNPQTIEEAQKLLKPQIDTTITIAARLDKKLRAREHLYVEAKLLPNYLAASYFPTELLNHIGAVPVGSRADKGQYVTRTKKYEAQTKRLIFTVPDEGLQKLKELVENGANTRSEEQAFSQIRELSEFSFPRRKDVLPPSEANITEEAKEIVWEAVLHPSTLQLGEQLPLDDETLDLWYELIKREGGEVYDKFIRRVGGLTFTPIRINTSKAVNLAQFNPLRLLRPMPTLRPRPKFGTPSSGQLRASSSQQPLRSDFSIAVFDGGVDTGRTTENLFSVPTPNLTTEPPVQEYLDHGTGVTGAVMYGMASPGDQVSPPSLPINSYRVLPPPPDDLEGYWVLDQIKKSVEEHDHKLVNLSLGPSLAVEDDMEPNRWTSELDQLAWEKDVLFVVAAGNDGDKDRVSGLHRIQVPADMINGLAVGACNIPYPDTPWVRSSYSSMGPGRYGSRIQPLGVQFGGDHDHPFNVIRADGTFYESAGTSFAAPLTTHALANLATHLPRVNSSVLRAFAVHFSERPKSHTKLRDEVGYGRQPTNFDSFLDCSSHEAHVLYVDEIERGKVLGYQLTVANEVNTELEVRITLAYASPVDPTQPTEYSNASLDLILRPHHRIHTFRPPKGTSEKAQKLDITSEEAGNLLKNGWTASQEPATKQLSPAKRDSSPEAQLRDSGKWETVRHYRISLKPGDVELPRLELSYLARRSGALDNSPTKVPFALLVSIIDKQGKAPIYDDIRSRFSTLRPIQQARSRIATRNSSSTSWF